MRLANGTIAYREYLSGATEKLSGELSALSKRASVELMASGSAAIECGLRAGGIGAGDRVAICAYDYPGNFWAVERVGARPVLFDVKPDSWRPDVDALTSAIDRREVAAVVVSHLHGEEMDLQQIRSQCDNRGVLLIEDACQSVGIALANNATTLGHMVAISFGGGKQLSCGRGGALLTESAKLSQKAKIASGAGSGPYALSELQAEVVLAQLDFLQQLEHTVGDYFGQVASELSRSNPGWKTPWVGEKHQNYKLNRGFYQAGFLVEHAIQADCVVRVLNENGIRAGSGFAGFHRRSSRRCDRAGSLIVTPQIVDRTVVVHHDIALTGRVGPIDLARMMLDVTKT